MNDPEAERVPLGLGSKMAYGAFGFGDSLLLETFNGFILLYYNTILEVPAKTVALALFIPRIWDAISDPIMGHISDNTRTRWGRRRPYILVGGLLCALSFISVWLPSKAWSERTIFGFLLVTSAVYYTFWTVATIPAWALGAELSMDYHERTKVWAYRGFFGRLGAVLAGASWYLAGKFPSFTQGYCVVGPVFAAIAFACFVWAFLGTRESAEPQRQERVGFVEGVRATASCGPFWALAALVMCVTVGVMVGFPAASYINIYYVYGGDAQAAGKMIMLFGVVGTVMVLLAVFGVTWLSKKLGKERAFMVGMLVCCSAPPVSWFVYTPKYPLLQLIFLVPLAIACAVMFIFPGAMLADLADLDELKTRKRREGSFSSLWTFISKLSLPGATFIFGWLLDDFAGFNPAAATQTPETILRLRIILLVGPLLPFVAALILACFYPVRERDVREARRILDARRTKELDGYAGPDEGAPPSLDVSLDRNVAGYE